MKITFIKRHAQRFAWQWRHRTVISAKHHSGLPRLLVDVSGIIQNDNRTGIQRVVRAVLVELARRNGEGFQLIPVYATATHGYCYASADYAEGLTTLRNPVPVQVSAGDKFLGLDLTSHIMPKYKQQLQSWQEHGVTIHIVVYDLLPLLHPDWFTPAAHKHFTNWIKLLATQADQAICISKIVASNLADRLGEHEPNSNLTITSIKLGADIANSQPSTGVCGQVDALLTRLKSRPAILMVGTIEPRKGHDIALDAFELLWRTEGPEAPDLVIVGRSGWKTEGLQQRIRSHREHGARLHWLDQVTDEGLGRLYEACRGVFIPSHAEGFGLPLAEAAAHHRYVLARNLPVLHEQGLNNVAYFSSNAPGALGPKLMELAAKGPAIESSIHATTWNDCVDNLIKALNITQTDRE